MSRTIQVRVLGSPGIYCEGLEKVLKEDSQITLVEVDFYFEAINPKGISAWPDVWVVCLSSLETSQPDFSRLSTLIKDLCSNTKVLLIADSANCFLNISVFKAGLRGFLVKDHIQAEDLLQAIKSVASGQLCFDPEVSTNVLNHFQEEQRLNGDHLHDRALTKRETGVLGLIREGCPNREIAEKLCISEGTVKSHIYSIFRKVGVTSRVQLVLRPIQNLT